MATVLRAAGWENIKVVRQIVRRSTERLTACDTQIASVLVSNGSQFRDYEREVGGRHQQYIHVDDWLGCQPGNRCATDVFNCRRHSLDHSLNP
jgi:hypothetical protein